MNESMLDEERIEELRKLESTKRDSLEHMKREMNLINVEDYCNFTISKIRKYRREHAA